MAALAFLAALGWACRAAVVALDPALQTAHAGALAWHNALPVVVAVLVLWVATGRALLSTWLGWWLLWALYAADALKLEHLDRHLVPGDLVLLPQLLGNVDLFSTYLGPNSAAVLALAGVLAAAALLARFEPRTLPRLRWRLLPMLAVLLLAGSLLRGDGFWRQQLSRESLAGFNVWSPDRSIARSGLVAGLVHLGWSSGVVVPDADLDRVLAFEHEHADQLALRRQPTGPLPLPDIVIVQSEAMFDPVRLRGVDADATLLPNLRRLAASGVHGEMRVPTYGGGTIRTEFEVLTGVSLRAFPDIAWPYYGLAMRPLPSLPHELATAGYRTLALHPYRRSFWNRDTALRRLGITESVFEDDAPLRDGARHGYYIADEHLYDATLAALSPDRPQFAFVITMENHGPWHARPQIDDDARRAVAVPDALRGRARRELQTYLLHLAEGDRALGAFAEALLARARPTLLVVYGDHLPGLAEVFDTLGFDDGLRADQQPVPYAIVANFPLPRQRIDLPSHLLAGLVLDLAEVPSGGYLALNARTRDLLPGSDAPQRARLEQMLHHAAWRAISAPDQPGALLMPVARSN